MNGPMRWWLRAYLLFAALQGLGIGLTGLLVLGFGLATALILVLTLLHWSEFMADPLPHRPVWIFDYVVDPLLELAIVPAAGLWPPRQAVRHRLTPVFVVQ